MSSLRPGFAALFGGAFSALLFLAFQTGTLGGLILLWMAQLPLFLVALSFGPFWGAAASGWAFGMLVVAFHLVVGVQYAVITPIPVLAMVFAALRGRKPDPAFMVLALAVVVVTAFVAADIVNSGATGGLQGRIRLTVAQIAAAAHESGIGWMDTGKLDALAAFVPGAAGCGMMLISIGNGVLAQGVLARFGWNRWASPRMALLTMPRWTSMFFAIALAAGAAGTGEVRFLGENLAMLAAVPLTFGGLAVAHCWTDKYPAYWPALPVLYVMTFVIGGTIPVIVALGVVEQWFGLRRRLVRPTEEKSDG